MVLSYFKKIVVLLITFICVTSCSQKKLKELNNRISELEVLNKKLSDSLKHQLKEKILHLTPIGFSETYESKLNEPCQINYAFCFGIDMDFPEYNVYRITNGKEEEKELILSKQNKSGFTYEFTPKTVKDDTVELLLEFNSDGKIQMPSHLFIAVE